MCLGACHASSLQCRKSEKSEKWPGMKPSVVRDSRAFDRAVEFLKRRSPLFAAKRRILTRKDLQRRRSHEMFTHVRVDPASTKPTLRILLCGRNSALQKGKLLEA